MTKEITLEKKVAVLNQMISQEKINQLLYKYRADCENTKKIFTEHTIWFAYPECFEDIKDCMANIQSLDERGLNDLIEKTHMTNYEKEMCKKGAKSFNIDMLQESSNNVTRKRIGISCFCKTETSDEMWSKYSDDHKGMCLQFDVLKDPELFTLAQPVNYVNKLPVYNHFTDRNELLNKVILSKTNDWKFEQEIRVVKVPSEMKTEKDGQAFSFKPLSLKKVIFGYKAKKETIDEYIKLCYQNGLDHVRFTQMYMENGSLKEKDIEKDI